MQWGLDEECMSVLLEHRPQVTQPARCSSLALEHAFSRLLTGSER